MSDDEALLQLRVGDAVQVREAFEELPLMVAAMDGPQLRFVAANAAYRALATSSEFIGAPLREVFPEGGGQQIFEAVERVYDTAEPYTMNEWRMQLGADETGQPREMYLDVHLAPRFTDDGAIRGVVGYITDVTARAQQRLAAQAQAADVERRYRQARDVIAALQRELLPSGLPVLPRVHIAGSYLLADADTAAGGDWFDGVTLPGGQVGLVVGDVVGHGVSASAVMGQLRAITAERLQAGATIPEALTALDAVANRIPGAHAATVCVAILDPNDGSLTYCTAGHPPPLLVPAHGEPRYLDVTGAGPLGVGAAFPLATAQLDPGDVLLIYTDGIVERPGRDIAASTVELAQVAADTVAGRGLRTAETSPVERVCTQTIELLTRATGHSDDITLLAAQLVTPAPILSLTAAATSESLAEIRVALDDWLDIAHVGATDADALRHAVVELVTNAADHAYVDSADQHTVTVTGEVTDTGHAELRVADEGSWREPRPSPDRGLGLQVTANLIDNLQIEHDATGTTAVVRHRLTRQVPLLTTGTRPSGTAVQRSAQADPLLVLEQPSTSGARFRIDGPVDGATAGTVEREISFAGSTGARSLLLDLTGVSHLASAGVAVLHRLAARHSGNGGELRLYAPPGTNADMIMTLVGLVHHTTDPDLGTGEQHPAATEDP
ncbi:SpoIIE family protein phosphatase [Amycolatopsis jiangsuensis]|uniref:Anti-anti-sigma factor n=1 Tax=Amycolatopsis jiangsuensis TaxID=1181879 RepID=A0A840IKQ6_9PSEU|nr:SpoIIE family protein phosphatase [Amycolatopsis jiangsuensis]MBB4682911.1 anti-anti-sigma factor [Amycolatopsis jiangsuensis]